VPSQFLCHRLIQCRSRRLRARTSYAMGTSPLDLAYERFGICAVGGFCCHGEVPIRTGVNPL